MPAAVLIATPHTAFGELLRMSLDDSRQYKARLVLSAKEARSLAGHTSFQLAILDAAISDEPFIPFCKSILEQQPGIRMVVIPPDNNPNHPALGGLIPHGYLSRPFYLPDLLEIVSRLLADREKQIQVQTPGSAAGVPAADPSATLPPWLQEPIILQGYLGKELANTQAIAAIAGLNGPLLGASSAGGGIAAGGVLRANAGALDDQAAQELTEIVFRYWNRAEKTDLMRFVRLNANKNDYLVYATHVKGEMVLILVYDTSAPLSQIRPQTKSMAQTLAALPPEEVRPERKNTAGGQSTRPDAAERKSPPVKSEPAGGLRGRGDLPAGPAGSQAASGSYAAQSGFTARESDTQPLVNTPPLDRTGRSVPPADSPSTSQNTPAQENETAAPALSPANASRPDGSNEEEDDDLGGGVINLTALLGSIPAPNPEDDNRRGSLMGGWYTERSASAPTPTLAGGMNGRGSSEQAASAPNEDGKPGVSALHSTPAPLTPSAADETGRPPDQRPKKRNVRTAPLDPQTIPRDSLPASPSLPVDYSLPIGSPPAGFETTGREVKEDVPAAPRRLAGLEVKTEPPVVPPGVPAPVEPRRAGSPPDSLSIPEPPVDSIEDTHPHLVSTITNMEQLEPVSAALSLLNYTCVLVPRLPHHYLTGELADRLAGWVQQLCLAFGWRLEGISIRPEYLQWTVQVAPAISPGNLVRIIRQRTSQHIFGNYAHLGDQNPSGDFWAPGYLIVSGVQPPSAQLLREYIAQTRKRQGVSK